MADFLVFLQFIVGLTLTDENSVVYIIVGLALLVLFFANIYYLEKEKTVIKVRQSKAEQKSRKKPRIAINV